MRREEIDRLLALLSTGELTPAERESLYNAALDDEALFEEIFAEQALAEALDDKTLRDEFLAGEGKREPVSAASAPAGKWRIPWWGWAVPAAVAASTVIGVFLLKEPARETSVAQTAAKKPVEMAQAQPAAATPAQAVQPASAPAAEALNALKKSREQAAPQSPPAPVVMEESKLDFAAVRDAKDEARKEKATGVAGGAPSGTVGGVVGGVVGGIRGQVVTDKPAVAASLAEADAHTAPARPAEAKAEQGDQRRSTESETRLAMRRDTVAPARQTREAPAAAPPVRAEKRAGAVGGVRNEATVSLVAKSALDESRQMAGAPVLQTLDESGQWSNADRSRPLSRNLKLRLKLVSHDDGFWELLGSSGRTVTLKRGETGYVDLPDYGPGEQAVELAFRPSDASAQRFRSNSAQALGRVRISFTIK